MGLGNAVAVYTLAVVDVDADSAEPVAVAAVLGSYQ